MPNKENAILVRDLLMTLGCVAVPRRSLELATIELHHVASSLLLSDP